MPKICYNWASTGGDGLLHKFLFNITPSALRIFPLAGFIYSTMQSNICCSTCDQTYFLYRQPSTALNKKLALERFFLQNEIYTLLIGQCLCLKSLNSLHTKFVILGDDNDTYEILQVLTNSSNSKCLSCTYVWSVHTSVLAMHLSRVC